MGVDRGQLACSGRQGRKEYRKYRASGDLLRTWQRGATERLWVSKGCDQILPLLVVVVGGAVQEGEQLGDDYSQLGEK